MKGILSYGASRGLCERHNITLKAVPSRKVANYMKPSQLKALDAALVELIAEQPHRILGFSAVRLLIHTGMRKSEVLTLRDDNGMIDLDGKVIHLGRDKTSGRNVGRDVLLSDTAVEILRGLPRQRRCGFVFLRTEARPALVRFDGLQERSA